MVGQAPTSLVSGDQNLRRPLLRWLSVLNVGFLLGSGAMMLLAWGLGGLVGTSTMSMQARIWILLAGIALFLVFDIPAALRGGSSRLGLRRQTPRTLGFTLRRVETTALWWGTDIGSGVSTYRMTSAIWLGLLAVFLGVVPFYVGWLYGVGTVLAITGLVALIGGGAALEANFSRLFAARRPVQLTYVVLLLSVGTAAVSTLVVA